MQTEKLVNEVLFGKTELKSEKVELGVVQDIDVVLKAANDLKKQSEPFGKEIFDLNSRIRTVLSKFQEIEKNSNNLENKSKELFNQFKKQATELGLNINGSDAEKKYEEILSQLLTLPTAKEAKDIILTSIK
jgi:chromosome segregation ATPase